ncbi:MAG: DUF4113 domain-containing protein [Proteobacteria bacterium]|nr:DUF4113 domain-containing protein [Pseudomonadota bacterium]
MSAVDQLNSLYGKGSVFVAASGIKKKWRDKKEKISGAFTTKWDEILVVRA